MRDPMATSHYVSFPISVRSAADSFLPTRTRMIALEAAQEKLTTMIDQGTLRYANARQAFHTHTP